MKCRKCRQIVLQAITESGRKVTLDPDPARGGTMRVIYRRAIPAWQAEIVPPSRLKQYPGELYRPHACKEKPCQE